MSDPGEKNALRTVVLLWVALLAVTALRALWAASAELSPDEAYYWTWSKQMALGFFDHPPMVAALIGFGTGLLGDCALGVRLGALLCGVLIGWLTFVNVRLLTGSARWGFWIALLANLSPLLSAGAVVHTPDAPLALFWSLAVTFGLRLMRSDRIGDWIGLGASIGLAMLSKGTGLLLLPALGIFLVGCQAGRSRLAGLGPLWAVLLAVGLVLPNLIWNARHASGSLGFQFQHAFAEMAFSPLDWLQFVSGQLGVLSPLLAVGLAAFVGVGGLRRVRNSRPDAFFLWCLSGPLVLFFLLLALLHKVEANWPAMAYLAALPGMGWCWTGGFWYLRRPAIWAVAALTVAAGMTVIIHLQALCPFLPLAPQHDPTERLRGWSELAREVVADADALDLGLAAEGYATVSELRFYTKRSVAYQPTQARRSQYDLWDNPVSSRVLLLQPMTSQGVPELCQQAKERWLLIKDGSRAGRVTDYRWWICEGLPAGPSAARGESDGR